MNSTSPSSVAKASAPPKTPSNGLDLTTIYESIDIACSWYSAVATSHLEKMIDALKRAYLFGKKNPSNTYFALNHGKSASSDLQRNTLDRTVLRGQHAALEKNCREEWSPDDERFFKSESEHLIYVIVVLWWIDFNSRYETSEFVWPIRQQ